MGLIYWGTTGQQPAHLTQSRQFRFICFVSFMQAIKWAVGWLVNNSWRFSEEDGIPLSLLIKFELTAAGRRTVRWIILHLHTNTHAGHMLKICHSAAFVGFVCLIKCHLMPAPDHCSGIAKICPGGQPSLSVSNTHRQTHSCQVRKTFMFI